MSFEEQHNEGSNFLHYLPFYGLNLKFKDFEHSVPGLGSRCICMCLSFMGLNWVNVESEPNVSAVGLSRVIVESEPNVSAVGLSWVQGGPNQDLLQVHYV